MSKIRKKRTIIILVVMLLISMITVVTGDAKPFIDGEAETIEVNTSYTSHLENWDDEQYYCFSLPSSGIVSYSFSHDYVDDIRDFWELQLLDKDKNELIYQTYQGKTVDEQRSPHIGLPAGTYYILIKPFLGHFDPAVFTFRINFEPSDVWETELNDYKHTATSVKLNTEYSGAFRSWEDKDYYCFTLSSAGSVSIDFSHDFTDETGEVWFLRLENENEERLFDGGYKGTDISVKTSNQIGLPEGTYYICVYSKSSLGTPTEDYRFSVNYAEDISWEQEFNDKMASVNPIELNRDYSGSLLSGNDKDYFGFTIPASGCISIRFSHDFCDTSDELWKIRILDKEENEYFSSSYRGDTLNARESDHIGLPAGNYYFEVLRGTQYSPVNYTFNILYSESDIWEKELNDNVHSANPITLDADWFGSLSANTDIDCFQFEMPAEGYLDVEFQHEYVDNPVNLWKLQIMTDENEEYDSFGFVGDTEGTEKPSTAEMPAGTYFVRVSKGDGYSSEDYRFSLKYHEISSIDLNNLLNGTDAQGITEWICPECGYKNDTLFCIKCGTPKPEKIICPGCGKEYDPDSGVVFCGTCGTKLQ